MTLFKRPDGISRLRDSPLLRLLIVALGFNTVFMLWLIKAAVEPQQGGFYHWSGTAANYFLPLTLDFLATWLMFILLLWASRSPGRLRVAVWSGLFLFMPWCIFKSCEFLSLIHPNHIGRLLFLGGAVATICLTLLWRPKFAPAFESFVASASTVMVFAGAFGILMLCRLAWYGSEAHALEGKYPLHQANATLPTKPNRIIWIVMDELSFQQTYEHRFPGLHLPAFDALANDSTVFTDAIPPAIYTQIVLPSLLNGQPYDQIRTSLTQLYGHDASTGKWRLFNQHDTVFMDAINAGYRTAIAGWYNPYCRIVSEVADQCFWVSRDDGLSMIPSGTIMYNTLSPFQTLMDSVPTFGFNSLHQDLIRLNSSSFRKESSTYIHVEDYRDLDAAAIRLLQDRSANFVFLHLPVPHPGGIYDRGKGRFSEPNSPSSYIDNLALADKCLAGIRQTLEQTGQWDSSTIVLMGDHGWRTQLWRHPNFTNGWNRTDEEASHSGQYDRRPVYIVKLPNQTTAARIDTPYNTVNTRQLFDKIMAHQINTPANLAAWAKSLPAPH